MQRIFILLTLVLFLSACGQKGDLFLKDADPQSSQATTAASSVTPEDQNKPKSGQ